MADTKISALTLLTGANAVSNDLTVVVDTSLGETKAMTREEFFDNAPIGTTTPAAGKFSTLTVGTTGELQLAAGSALILSGAFATTLTATAVTGVTLPTTGTLATLAGAEELDNKTLDASVAKGVWTASGTWTLPAATLGGTISGGGNQVNNVIIGAVTPLAGDFTTLTASGVLATSDTTEATSTTAASLKTAGGLGVVKHSWLTSLTLKLVTNSANTYTVLSTDHTIIQTTIASVYTLPAAASFPGRQLHLVTQFAGTVTSASSNVVPIAGTAAGTAILAATAGKYAILQSNGTNWINIGAN